MLFLCIIALKKVFAENKEIQKLAEQFVLLNLVVSFLFIITDISHYSKWMIISPVHRNHVWDE